ncbi:MAG TPA: AEC family transporter, partial [Clostridiales bacterium]|nr:AEC family transporter [Clostridiales bacterium]
MTETVQITANQIMILFFLIFIGFVARKRNIIDLPFGKKASELLVMVTTPALILISFNFDFSRELLTRGFIVLAMGFVAHALAILAASFLFRKVRDDRKRHILIFASVFSNCIFMGFPVMESLFGKEGIFLSSFYLISFNTVIWTYGYMIMSGEKGLHSIKYALKNPALSAIGLGLLMFVLGIRMPVLLEKVLQIVGSMTTPLSMLLIGSQLAGVRILGV